MPSSKLGEDKQLYCLCINQKNGMYSSTSGNIGDQCSSIWCRRASFRAEQVSLDLASFEVVRCCWPALEQLLDAGLLHTVFCNEEEAAALLAKAKPAAAAAAAVVSTVEVAARTASQSAAAHEATPAVQQQQQRQEAELPKGSGTAEERCSRTPSEEVNCKDDSPMTTLARTCSAWRFAILGASHVTSVHGNGSIYLIECTGSVWK